MSRKPESEWGTAEYVILGAVLGVLPFVLIRPLCVLIVAVHRAL